MNRKRQLNIQSFGLLMCLVAMIVAPAHAQTADDTTVGLWSVRAPMPTAREGVRVGLVADVVYAVGGSGGTANPPNAA